MTGELTNTLKDANTVSLRKTSSLSDCVKSLVNLEWALTSTLESTEALLDLATPKSQLEVEHVLAIARSYSTKTSAPPGWSPSLPVLHFSTPNPLPHQLRRGNLSMMELEIIRQEKRDRLDHKRKQMHQDEVRAQKLKLEQQQQMEREAKDPKKKELHVHYQMEDESERNVLHDRKEKLGEKQIVLDQKEVHLGTTQRLTGTSVTISNEPKETKASVISSSSAAMTMNLSDSESSTSSSSSEIDEEEEE